MQRSLGSLGFLSLSGFESSIPSEASVHDLSLVSKVVTVDESKVVACKCRSQFCKDCMPGIMVRLREKLRPVVESWVNPQMLTLTISRDFQKSAVDAYEECQRLRKVSELVRSLERKGMVRKARMFYAIEFHKDGWPHWHILLDSIFIEYEYAKERWGLGHVWISNNRKFESKAHAVHYVTKYVGKLENNLPDWVLDYRGNIRRFSSSRGLFGITKRKKKGVDPDRIKKSRVRRTPRERVKICGLNSCLFTVSPDGKWKFKKVLNLPFWLVGGLSVGEIEMAIEDRLIPAHVLDDFLKEMFQLDALIQGKYLCYHDRKVLKEKEDREVEEWACRLFV